MPIEPIILNELPLIIPDFWAIMTIIQEAESEGPLGMQAVGEVIRKRTRERIFSDGTLASTVLWPYQFSGWNSKDPGRIRVANMDLDNPIVFQAIGAWKRSKNSNLTLGATHYLNKSIVNPLPAWANVYNLVTEVGKHTFYLVK